MPSTQKYPMYRVDIYWLDRKGSRGPVHAWSYIGSQAMTTEQAESGYQNAVAQYPLPKYGVTLTKIDKTEHSDVDRRVIQVSWVKRWYVTMSWDNYPEGGTYGDIFVASDEEAAEQLCRQAMAESRAEEDDDHPDTEYWLRSYADDWHVIDCWDLDEFITRNANWSVEQLEAAWLKQRSNNQ